MSSNQRSKKILTALGALLITFLLAYQFKANEPDPSKAAPNKTDLTQNGLPREGSDSGGQKPEALQKQKPLGSSTAMQSVRPLASPPTGKGNPVYASKPNDSVVEFEIKDGYAVAFGDLVLGRPPADFDQVRGLAEVARPNLWIRGEVPYVIQSDLQNPERVMAAIQMFHQSTGLKFVPHTDQPDALSFTQSNEHCSSYLGRVGGMQPVFLSDKCSPVDIAHEMMHALGFIHEQSRTDRDQFLSIEWDNIQEKYQNQFAIVPEALMEVLGGSPFDPESILMYGRTAFAVNPQKSVMKLKNGNEVHAAPKGLSESDVERVNRLYRN